MALAPALAVSAREPLHASLPRFGAGTSVAGPSWAVWSRQPRTRRAGSAAC